MNKNLIITKTANYVKTKLKDEASGHDWWHAYRVWQMGKHINKTEKGDSFIIELAALLHDISDWKFSNHNENTGPKLAHAWLTKMHVDKEIINHVCQIMISLSFKGANHKSVMQTKEGKIVQDADRLEAIGAIGIARAFATGARFNEVLYDPSIPTPKYKDSEHYKKSKGQKGRTTINHFYEKLLLLKNLMNTKAAKRIALKRHKYMEDFLDRFYKEWQGKL